MYANATGALAPATGALAPTSRALGHGRTAPPLPAVHDQAHCPVCACSMDEEPVTCPRCDTPHHAECWDYAGGCAIFGCDRSNFRLPVSHEAFVELQSKTRLWAYLFRCQWALVTIATVALVVTLCGALLPHHLPWSYNTLMAIFRAFCRKTPIMFTLGAIVCQFSVLGYLSLLLPAQAYQRQLEGSLDEALAGPREGSRQLVDRIALPWFERGLSWLIWGSIAFVGLVLVCLCYAEWTLPARWAGAINHFDANLLILLGVSFPLAVTVASRRRIGYVQSVQNRLMATLKGKSTALTSGASS